MDECRARLTTLREPRPVIASAPGSRGRRPGGVLAGGKPVLLSARTKLLGLADHPGGVRQGAGGPTPRCAWGCRAGGRRLVSGN